MDQKNQEKNTNTDITLFGLFATAVTLIASLVYQYSKDVLTTEFQIHMNGTICKSQNITVTQEYNKVVPTFLSEYVLIAVFSLFMMISFMWAYVYSEDKIGKIKREFFRNTAGEFLDSFIILSISVVIGLSQVSKDNISNIMYIITGIALWVIAFFVIFIMLIYVAMKKLKTPGEINLVILVIVVVLAVIFLEILPYYFCSFYSLVVFASIIIVLFWIILNFSVILSILASITLLFLCLANGYIVNKSCSLVSINNNLDLLELYVLVFIIKFTIDNILSE